MLKSVMSGMLQGSCEVFCPYLSQRIEVGGEIVGRPQNFRTCFAECPLARKGYSEGALINMGGMVVLRCTKDGSVLIDEGSEIGESVLEPGD